MRNAVYMNNAGVTLLRKGQYLAAVDCLIEAVTVLSLFCGFPGAPSSLAPEYLLWYSESLKIKMERIPQVLAAAGMSDNFPITTNSMSGAFLTKDRWNILALDKAAEFCATPQDDRRSTLIRIEDLLLDDEVYLNEIVPSCMLLNYAISHDILNNTRGSAVTNSYLPTEQKFAQSMKPQPFYDCYPNTNDTTAPPSTHATATMNSTSAPVLLVQTPLIQTTLLLDHALHLLQIKPILASCTNGGASWCRNRLTGYHVFVAKAILHRHPKGLEEWEKTCMEKIDLSKTPSGLHHNIAAAGA